MPTPSDFSNVQFSQSEQSYKQTERESRSGDFDFQGEVSIAGAGKPVGSGNYPRVYDGTAGSEPHAADYYIDSVYSRISATGPDSSYMKNEQQSISGEFGPTRGQREGGRATQGDNELPDPVRSKQFSSDTNGDPKVLLQSTVADVAMHASINQCYGLNQPAATLGSHPWLRDELTNTGETEPGNAVPNPSIKTPFKGAR